MLRPPPLRVQRPDTLQRRALSHGGRIVRGGPAVCVERRGPKDSGAWFEGVQSRGLRIFVHRCGGEGLGAYTGARERNANTLKAPDGLRSRASMDAGTGGALHRCPLE